MKLIEVKVVLSDEVVIVPAFKTTTCDDVIQLAAGQTPGVTFAAFESGFGVERQLHPDTRLRKLARSWGSQSDSFSIVVRPADNVTGKRPHVSSARRKLQRLREMVQQKCPFVGRRDSTILNNLNSKVPKSYTKDVTMCFNVDSVTEPGLCDMKITLPTRTRGDGMDVSDLPLRLRGDGCDGDVDDMSDITCWTLSDADLGFLADDLEASHVSLLNECMVYDAEESAHFYCD